MTLRRITVAGGVGAAMALGACNTDQGTVAENACQAVAAELMRSPESLKVVSRLGHGSEVFMEVRAANAYGTSVRSTVVCRMEGGQGSDRVDSVTVNGEQADPYAVLAASVRVSNARMMKNLD